MWVGQQDLDAQPGTWAQGVHQAPGSLKESRPYSEKQWAIGGLWMTGGYTSSHSGGDHDGRDYDYEHEERAAVTTKPVNCVPEPWGQSPFTFHLVLRA